MRNAGPYRIATELRFQGYSVEVIDFCGYYSIEQTKNLIESRCDRKTKFISWSTSFFFSRGPKLSMNTLKRTTGLCYSKEEETDLIDWIKANYPQAKIIIGGHRSLYRDVHRADYYILGYGENAISAVMQHILDGQHPLQGSVNPDGSIYIDANTAYPKHDVQDLPILWHANDFIGSRESIPIETARGCIFRCAFCGFPGNGKRKLDYVRDPRTLKDEFARNHDLWGTTNYSFIDDTYNDSMEKVKQVADVVRSLPFHIKFTAYLRLDLLIKFPEMVAHLLDTGLESAVFGIETANPQTARIIGKGTPFPKQMDQIRRIMETSRGAIAMHSNFLLGLPEESIESCRKTHEYLLSDDNPLESWNWFGLGIMSQKDRIWASEIELNPEKFGYTVVDTGESPICWSNKFMDSATAGNFAARFNSELKNRASIGGWMINPMKGIGYDIDFIRDRTKSDFPWAEAADKKKRYAADYYRRKMDL